MAMAPGRKELQAAYAPSSEADGAGLPTSVSLSCRAPVTKFDMTSSPTTAGRCLAIGNFEGVHRGHQWVIRHVRQTAADFGAVPSVLTFSPHPRDRLAPRRSGAALSRIQSLHEKVATLLRYGIEDVCVQRFTRRFSRIEPQAFIQEILLDRLRTRVVCVGEDFRFGRARTGDIALLRALGDRFGFAVSVVPAYRDPQTAERVSSTLLRAALARGDLANAASLLGRDFSMMAQLTAERPSSWEVRLSNRYPPSIAGQFDVVVQRGCEELAFGQLQIAKTSCVAALNLEQVSCQASSISARAWIELRLLRRHGP